LIGAEAAMNFKTALLAAAMAAGSACAPPKAALSSRDYILDVYLPGEQWRPTREEAAEAKAALLDYLTVGELPAGDSPQSFTIAYLPIIEERIGGYSLQYFGGYYSWRQGRAVPDRSGEKEIFVNGLCKGPWLQEGVAKQLITVNDGGACFFHALYSPAQKRIMMFSVNGQA
jgi:hypothetical protein